MISPNSAEPGNQLLMGGASLKKLNSGAAVGSNPAGSGWSNYFAVMTTSGVLNGTQAVQGWLMGQSGFFGPRFLSPTSSHLYGWGEILFDPTSANTNGYGFQITQAYYDDSGSPITAGDDGSGGGAVPEPSTMALALLAAGGVVAYRVRKQTLAS